ncbi:MAG: hypothetical protein KDD47_28210 [Acidobacteria bacterium]|nr:hypothetical protein [Acidobacteriota bacterium]
MLELNRQARMMLLGGLFLLGCTSTQPAEEPAAPIEAAEAAPAATPADSEAKEKAPDLDLLNARYPLPGVLTGGQPSWEQLAEASKEGYKTIVNLRSLRETAGEEEAAEVAKLGMRYVAIPLAGSADLTGDNVDALNAVLADESAYPMMIHCGSGNRVGALLAVRAAYTEGMEAADALAFGLEAGLTTLEDPVRSILGLPVQHPE